MPVPRIYVDTSVLGGCFDAEFELWSNGLMDDFRAGRFRPVLSEVTAAEVVDAPPQVREVHDELLSMEAQIITVGSEVLALMRAYEDRAILPPRFRNDMLHIALATAAEVDVLVSWNFRHIVRLDKINAFNLVNHDQGYNALSIYSPREVTTYEQQNDSHNSNGTSDS